MSEEKGGIGKIKKNKMCKFNMCKFNTMFKEGTLDMGSLEFYINSRLPRKLTPSARIAISGWWQHRLMGEDPIKSTLRIAKVLAILKQEYPNSWHENMHKFFYEIKNLSLSEENNKFLEATINYVACRF